LIINGKGGYIYDCNDVKGFAEGMKKIVYGKDNVMGRRNIETMKRFDIDTVNINMRNIYHGLLN